jgi:hypothetical protein
LFTVSELGLGQDPEPFVDRLMREFLKIGEAVAARWIEMPRGILILQAAPEREDSGAIYLYDRKEHIFFMVGFDGPDDNLTLAEFNQLLDEYGLLKYAETPSLVREHPERQEPEHASPVRPQPLRQPKLWDVALPLFRLSSRTCTELAVGRAVTTYIHHGSVRFWFQTPGSA